MALEITDIGPRHLVLEEKPPLARLILVSVAGAGLLLTLGTMKEYGWQSWYRLTYWLGALVALLAGVGWGLWGRSTRCEVRLETRRLRLWYRQGLRTALDRTIHLDRIQGLEMEQRPGSRPAYRLSLLLEEDERLVLNARGTYDRTGLEAVAGRLKAYLEAT